MKGRAVLMGGTGVPPVKSGVAPDFAGKVRLWLRDVPEQSFAAGGSGRDARNDRPEACPTHGHCCAPSYGLRGDGLGSGIVLPELPGEV